MRPKPLKGEWYHPRLMPEFSGEDGGFKESDVRSAVAWKILEDDLAWKAYKKEFISLIGLEKKLKSNTVRAFEDVLKK